MKVGGDRDLVKPALAERDRVLCEIGEVHRGIDVGAALALAKVMGARMISGRFLSSRDEQLPEVVLGSGAAENLQIYHLNGRPMVLIGNAKHEPFVVPLYALIAAPSAGFLIGALAGLYPATKAARLSPTEALRA